MKHRDEAAAEPGRITIARGTRDASHGRNYSPPSPLIPLHRSRKRMRTTKLIVQSTVWCEGLVWRTAANRLADRRDWKFLQEIYFCKSDFMMSFARRAALFCWRRLATCEWLSSGSRFFAGRLHLFWSLCPAAAVGGCSERIGSYCIVAFVVEDDTPKMLCSDCRSIITITRWKTENDL